MSYRLEQIKHKANAILAPMISDLSSKYILTIAEIEVSADLRYADIYLSIFHTHHNGKHREIDQYDFNQVEALIRNDYDSLNTAFIRKYQSRKSPILRFHIDKRQLHISHIDYLLKTSKESL